MLQDAPTWVRVLQAAVIGVVAGLALNAIFSMVVVRGEGLDGTGRVEPKACKKRAPARDANTPAPNVPSIGAAGWTFSTNS